MVAHINLWVCMRCLVFSVISLFGSLGLHDRSFFFPFFVCNLVLFPIMRLTNFVMRFWFGRMCYLARLMFLCGQFKVDVVISQVPYLLSYIREIVAVTLSIFIA